ncbi:MAG TPA: hypothetical protein VNA22_09255 [Pyrinomonadaceae bacterium]|nr:hypothetical protein [Pyrinomonadaceae bacterium]
MGKEVLVARGDELVKPGVEPLRRNARLVKQEARSLKASNIACLFDPFRVAWIFTI